MIPDTSAGNIDETEEMTVIIPMIDDVKHVSWFNWSHGLEFTYIMKNGRIDCMMEKDLKSTGKQLEIRDDCLKDRPFKEIGYPLKGSGYVSGYSFRNGKTYADVIVTSRYLGHILVEVLPNGQYDDGEVLFPPQVDTDEKKMTWTTSRYWQERGILLECDKKK
jgi:hypothetical protein